MQFLLEVTVVIVALFLGMVFTPVSAKRAGGRLLRHDRSTPGFGTGLSVPPRRRYRH